MKIVIVGAGIFTAEDLVGYTVSPLWRKATRNMTMAAASIERALESSGLAVRGNPEVGLVLGSSSGELETSAEFMSTLAKSAMARPLLFQNSLHNATTGFASIAFQLTGPSFTVSVGENTPEECLRMAGTA